MVGISKVTPVRVISPLKVGSKDKNKKENPTATQQTSKKRSLKDGETSVKRIDERI